MKIIKNPKKMQLEIERISSKKKSIGFVPTMGALHAGHISLIRSSIKENQITIVSIFVNPTQFGRGEDYKKYPRVLNKDIKKLKTLKVDYLFCPSKEDMYPEGFSSFLNIKNDKHKKLYASLCGTFRFGHFDGVAVIVVKLFNIIKPDRAYFGAKDYQQSLIIKKVVNDLNMSIKVRVLPIVREKDGLAMSSRNKYLSSVERKKACNIFKILQDAKKNLLGSNGSVSKIRERAIAELKKTTRKIDYLEIVDGKTLDPVTKITREILVAVACFVGKTRLIDNVTIKKE